MPEPICPFARQRLLARASSKPIIEPTATAAHTAVTDAGGQQLGDYFEHAQADAHFYVDRDGTLWQYLPVDRKSWAQYTGNDHVIAYETWDGGNPANPWNPSQLDTIARLLAWLYRTWNISLDVSTTATGPGAGWHSKYPEWNTDAHNCPGSTRVGQLVQEVLPAVHRLVDLPAPTPPQEDDMPRIVGGTPSWCARQGDQAFPRHQALWETPTPGDFKTGNTIVASVDGAPFTPPHHDGQKGPGGAWEDFIWQGRWWRRWFNTGVPINFGEVAGVYFLDADNGTYDVALRP